MAQYTYQFPLDMGSINYNATISFQALKLRPYDVATLYRVTKNQLKQSGDEAVQAAVTQAEDVADRAFLKDGLSYNGGRNETIVGSNTEIEQTLENCKLYLPQAIQINDGAQYDNINLGVVGATTAAGMRAGEGVIDAVAEGAVAAAGGMVDAFRARTMGSAQARLAVSRAASFIPGQAVSGAIQSGTRVSLNPNTQAMFKAVPLREFTFTFKMIPTTAEEAQEIKKIIKFFRSELYPEVITLDGSASGIAAGYEFPNVFRIEMKYNDDKQLATKILPSYLRNFTATYNASSMGFHKDGEFTEVDISMTFMEHTTLHKKLIEQDY